MKLHIITSIVVHVGVLAVFLSIFFFTIAVSVEKNIISDQIEFLVNSLIGNVFKGISKNDKIIIKNEINSKMDNINFKDLDEKTKKNNNKIFINNLIFIGTLLAFVIVLLTFLSYVDKKEFSFKLVMFGAILSLIFVAITETSFLLLIGSNYISTDPNKIKEKIVDKLYKNRRDFTSPPGKPI